MSLVVTRTKANGSWLALVEPPGKLPQVLDHRLAAVAREIVRFQEPVEQKGGVVFDGDAVENIICCILAGLWTGFGHLWTPFGHELSE
jgi:uncharacterized membrane protein YccF (DUF307 family)